MSTIALRHGATIDKFIGDAILLFFGDPETRGVSEDAKACVRMALEMQTRLTELNVELRRRGVEKPFRARMGINTGYCNVGNFGSAERMDYTIIGAEANLAARLETIAEPGGIVTSYETFVLVQDMVEAEQLKPTKFKGIAREVIPYAVKSIEQNSAAADEEIPGIRLFLDIEAMDNSSINAAQKVLENALKTVNAHKEANP